MSGTNWFAGGTGAHEVLSLLRWGIAFAICASTAGFSQVEHPAPQESATAAISEDDPELAKRECGGKRATKASEEKRGVFVGVPVPVSSPAIGSGVVLMGGFIFPFSKKDSISPPSLIGGAALFTNNGSDGFALAAELYFKKDRYHVVTGYARANLNYDFYGTGNVAGDAGLKFGLKQNVSAFFVQGTRRLFWRIFVGPRLLVGTTTLAAQHLGENRPGLPDLNVAFDLRSLGLKVERDTSTNRFYPINGTKIKLSADFFADVLGSTFTFQTYSGTFNIYHSFTKSQVLAYNAYVCATGGSAPFFGQCIFGTRNELRGYPAGRYIDRDMLATQFEYRIVLPRRFGLALFAGLGEVGPSFGAFNYDNLLPSVGFGPRFQLSKKYHVNLRADFAQGKNERTFSMGLAEAF